MWQFEGGKEGPASEFEPREKVIDEEPRSLRRNTLLSFMEEEKLEISAIPDPEKPKWHDNFYYFVSLHTLVKVVIFVFGITTL